jgi:hypothetical protein
MRETMGVCACSVATLQMEDVSHSIPANVGGYY